MPTLPANRRSLTPAAQKKDKLHPDKIEETIFDHWNSIVETFDPTQELITNRETQLKALVRQFLFKEPPPFELAPQRKWTHDYKRETLEELRQSLISTNFEERLLKSDLFSARNFIYEHQLSNIDSKAAKDKMYASFTTAYMVEIIARRFPKFNSNGLSALVALNILPLHKIISSDDFLLKSIARNFEVSEIDLVAHLIDYERANEQEHVSALLEMIDIYHGTIQDSDASIELWHDERAAEIKAKEDSVAIRRQIELEMGVPHGPFLNPKEEKDRQRHLAKAARRKQVEETIAAASSETEKSELAMAYEKETKREKRAETFTRLKDAMDRKRQQALESASAEPEVSIEEQNEILKCALETIHDEALQNGLLSTVFLYNLSIEVGYLSENSKDTIEEKISKAYKQLFKPHSIYQQLVQDIATTNLTLNPNTPKESIALEFSHPIQIGARRMYGRVISIASEALLLIEIVEDLLYQVAQEEILNPEKVSACKAISDRLESGLKDINDMLYCDSSNGEFPNISNHQDWKILIPTNLEPHDLSDDDIDYLSEIFNVPPEFVPYRYAKIKIKTTIDAILKARAVRVDAKTAAARNYFGISQSNAKQKVCTIERQAIDQGPFAIFSRSIRDANIALALGLAEPDTDLSIIPHFKNIYPQDAQDVLENYPELSKELKAVTSALESLGLDFKTFVL